MSISEDHQQQLDIEPVGKSNREAIPDSLKIKVQQTLHLSDDSLISEPLPTYHTLRCIKSAYSTVVIYEKGSVVVCSNKYYQLIKFIQVNDQYIAIGALLQRDHGIHDSPFCSARVTKDIAVLMVTRLSKPAVYYVSPDNIFYILDL